MKKLTAIIVSFQVLFIFSIHLFSPVQGAKILNIAFMGSKSHKITYEPLLLELAKRGHEVVSVSPLKSTGSKNFRHIFSLDAEAFLSNLPNFFEMSSFKASLFGGVIDPYIGLGSLIAEVCEKSYKLPQVKDILKEKYDLVIFSPFFNECLYGLIHKLNTSTVLFTQTKVFPWISSSFGTPLPPSFCPDIFSRFSDKMDFVERLVSFLGIGFHWLVQRLYYYPTMEAIYREALNDSSLPSIPDIERDASIVLSNSHVSFTTPIPYMPDTIEVGGMHLAPAKPVHKDLEDFLSGGKDGFVFFSMGTALKGRNMPESTRKKFLNVFSKLKQRVLWKWDAENMKDLPSNVKLSKWLPQQDVLGHKNIRLFITHGGHGGVQEAIYHAVPILGIPIFGDQPQNIFRAHELGIAPPPVVISEVTENILLEYIHEVMNNASYLENVKRQSKIFQDQIDNPIDRAVFWTEYVLRHKGAVHLRSAARDLNFVQYYSLDVLTVLGIVAFIWIKISILMLTWFLRTITAKKTKPATKPAAKPKKQKKN